MEFQAPAKQAGSAMEKIVLDFNQVGVIKFGQFQLKSGVLSPIYIDLREIISFPSLLKTAASVIEATIYERDGVAHDVICGVPYAALPIATLVACQRNTPMVMRRKETKSYGTKKVVEGKIEPGSRCIIIDDVCTSGASILETAKDLLAVGLIVTDAVVLLDRQAGGAENLAQLGITLHAALTLSQICNILVQFGQLSEAVAQQVETFILSSRENLADENASSVSTAISWKSMHFAERKKLAKNEMAKRLYQIMLEKETNLAVAADLTTSAAVLKLANAIGQDICFLKIHADIIEDFSAEFVADLKKAANKFNFLIMEDRKFADIGFTVSHQLAGGIHRIADWADLVTIHALPGAGILDGLKKGMEKHARNLNGVLVADMSSKGALTGPDYVAGTVKIAEEHRENIVGFVTQSDLLNEPAFIRMTPGVHISAAGDALGQQYHSVEEVVGLCADIIIVGRGVTEATDSAAAAAAYKTEGFRAYRRRVDKL